MRKLGKKKLGILGGSFDPPHVGHLKISIEAKKRFKLSARGKVITAQAGKRHGMIKRTNSQIRKQRGTTVLSKQDSKIVKSYMPYNLRG